MAPSTHLRKTSHSWALLFPILMGMAYAPTSQAQPKPSQADYKKAEGLFNEAEFLYKAGEYSQALEKYKQSYLLSKESSILFNMAQCYRYMNKTEDALKTYKYFLEENPKVSFRAEVEKIISDLERPPKQEPATKPIEVTPIEPATKPVEIKPIEPMTKPAEVTPIETATTITPTNEEKQTFSKKSKKLFLLSGAMGVTSLSLGIAAFSSTTQAQAESTVQAPNLPDTQAISALKQKAILRGALSDAFLVGTIVSGVAAFLSPRERVTISVSPSFQGAFVQGSF
jgi:tetratricopeptide (TPR) repeat protein